MIKCNRTCITTDFGQCCLECLRADSCETKCEDVPTECSDSHIEGTALETFQFKAAAVILKIGELVKAKTEIEEAEKAMREKLKQVMESHGIKKFENNILKITYVEASARTSIDSTKLKAQMPDVYAKFSKTSNVKSFVKIELKGAEK